MFESILMAYRSLSATRWHFESGREKLKNADTRDNRIKRAGGKRRALASRRNRLQLYWLMIHSTGEREMSRSKERIERRPRGAVVKNASYTMRRLGR